jgi:hypothetical protein
MELGDTKIFKKSNTHIYIYFLDFFSFKRTIDRFFEAVLVCMNRSRSQKNLVCCLIFLFLFLLQAR